MAQIKLELEKEVFVPYKVLIKMEEEEIPHNKYQWQEDDEYNYGQHWKTKGY